MFDKTYPLMTWGQAAMFPMLMPLTALLMYALIGAIDPAFEVTCQRSAAAPDQATCVARQWTLLSTRPSATFSLSETKIELEPSGKTRVLRIVTPQGPLDLNKRVYGASAREIKQGLDAFARSTEPASLTMRGGFSGKPFFVITPILMLLMLIPVAGMGGTLTVTATPGELRVSRRRPLGSAASDVLRFDPPARPRLWVKRWGGRHRSMGQLWGEVAGQQVVLVKQGYVEVLDRIASDVNQHHGVSPPGA